MEKDRLLEALLQQYMQQQFMEQDPAYLDAASVYQTVPEQQKLQEFLLKQAAADQETAMPAGQHVRDNMYVAPSPIAVAAAAGKQIMGANAQRDALAEITKLLRFKAGANRMGIDADQNMQRARMQQQPQSEFIPPSWPQEQP